MKYFEFDFSRMDYNGYEPEETVTVNYEVDNSNIHITQILTAGVDILPVIGALGVLKPFMIQAEEDLEMRRQKAIYDAYPHLAKPSTQEEQAEILKLK